MSKPKADDSSSSPQVLESSSDISVVRSITDGNRKERAQPDGENRSLTDEELLARLGYKQEFKRDFSHIELFGMAFSIVGVVQGIA